MKKPALFVVAGVAVATGLSVWAARSFVYQPTRTVNMEFITATTDGTTTYQMRIRQEHSEMTSSLPGRPSSLSWSGSIFTVQGDHFSSSLALPQPTSGSVTLQLLQTEKVHTPHENSSSSHGFVRPIVAGERFELK